jgi:hypothetical protein
MSATLTATAYAYPWDIVGDPDAPARLRALGVDSVTLAGAYHSVRAATPRHPHHRIVDASAAALYVPVRADIWRGHRLVPRSGAQWAGDDSFRRARDALAEAGLVTQAWVVATHGTALGDAAPELSVRNAYGDSYRYALCPSSPDVRRYAATLVSEVAVLGGVDAMVIEACGPLGVAHQSRHEKTAGADWTGTDEALLSICFCASCCVGYDERGFDPEAIGRRVRSRTGVGAPDIEAALEDIGPTVLAVRRTATLALRDDLIRAARSSGIGRLSFHASLDPWETGPMSALVDQTQAVDTYIASCWSQTLESVERVSRLDTTPKGDATVGAYCTILPPAVPHSETLLSHWTSLIRAGASELHLYHGGLASTSRLDAAANALAGLRSGALHN